MKITFGETIAAAPKGFVRLRLTTESKGTERIVREGAIDWLELGAGKPEDMNPRRFNILCRSIIRAARKMKYKKIAIQFDLTPELFKNLQSLTSEEIASLAAQNFAMADFEFITFKTRPKDGWPRIEEVHWCGAAQKSIYDAAERGKIIGEAVNACRELANTPGGDMTPMKLAKAAKTAAAKLPITIKTLGREDMEKLGMGALLGVAKGSTEEPSFTIMEYKGGKGKPIVLAGKGITFDSGGLNIKPEASMYEMHMDMSGAAAVIHTIVLAARLKVKKHVIALVPSAENMPGNNAYRPGDVLKSLSGKTIEVLNTDAEGRLILADALTYAKRLNPAAVIDVATLTGAVIVALGLHASGLMTKDDELADALLASGEKTGDLAWRLPLWDEYEDSVKSTFADVANVPGNGSSSRYGGAINGAMFLWQFAKELEVPWAHLDIASRMTAAPGDELAKGAAGAPVRLLLDFIEGWPTKS